MAGHFPFSGKGGRASTTAFYEVKRYNDDNQEKYYKFWFDWTKSFVESDAELSVTKSIAFASYPYGQHSHTPFHLNGKYWAVCLEDLGSFLRGVVLPKLDDDAMHKLVDAHNAAVAEIDKAAEADPKEPNPDVGYFRHT